MMDDVQLILGQLAADQIEASQICYLQSRTQTEVTSITDDITSSAHSFTETVPSPQPLVKVVLHLAAEAFYLSVWDIVN